LRRSLSAVFVLLIPAILLLAAGCATVFKGKTESIEVASNPPGADVFINGQLMGTTPATIKVNGTVQQSLEFRKDGYQSRAVMVTSSLGGGWLVLDIIFGLVPVIVDAATGNWNSLDANSVNTKLEKK